MRYQVLGRSILLCTVLCVSLGTSACSFVIGFSIKNLSDRELTVSYSLRNMEFGLEPELVDGSKNEILS